MTKLNRKFTVAPMLDWTDRHCRYFHRLLTKQAVLYTEMVTTGALLHGDSERHLRFNQEEHPVALQLGGSDPQDMAECARLAEAYGYDEVNINVGCPSERVQRGAFGACLMAEPDLIAECVTAMQAAVNIPITQEFPALEIIINGGITTLEQCQQHLQHVDGVMVGREAYHNPWLLAQVDPLIYGTDAPFLDRKAAFEAFLDYVQAQQAAGVALNHMSRHILGLFQGMPGARAFRRLISENAHKQSAGIALLRESAAKIA